MDTIVYVMENPMKKFLSGKPPWLEWLNELNELLNYGFVHGKSYKDGTKLGDLL